MVISYEKNQIKKVVPKAPNWNTFFCLTSDSILLWVRYEADRTLLDKNIVPNKNAGSRYQLYYRNFNPKHSRESTVEMSGSSRKRTRSNFDQTPKTTTIKTNSVTSNFTRNDFPDIDCDTAEKSLGILDRRLLFKDFLRLKLGQTVIVLVHRGYKHFDQRKEIMLAHYYQVSVLSTQYFNNKLYYAIPMVVATHPLPHALFGMNQGATGINCIQLMS